jgi:dipeptidyl-peptidase-4
MRLRLSFLAVLIAFAPAVFGQQKLLTLEDVYDPAERVDWNGRLPAIQWLKDNKHYLRIETDRKAKTSVWHKVEAESGRTEPFYDSDRLEEALGAVAGVGGEEAERLARQASYPMSSDEDAFLLEAGDDLYLYEIAAGRLERLTSTPEKELEPSFSPDARRIAFVRDNDLFVVDRSTGVERALTDDGSPVILNGILDWVYQEEIYGRGRFRGYWWSPDGRRLAFLRLDETSVPEYTVLDHIPYRPTVEVTRYPKAGDPNPAVRVGIVEAAGGAPRWADLFKYENAEILVVGVSWTRDSKEVAFRVQDREQTWLDLNLAQARNGATTTLLRETSGAWVNELGDPEWLDDGSFLWFSERSGFKHLYHYAKDGKLVRPVTAGRFEVQSLHGVDGKSRAAFFSASERNPIGSDVYRIGLDGTGLKRLTEAPGTHQALFNGALTHFVDTWSDVRTPPRRSLWRASGERVRPLEENTIPELAEYRLSPPELRQVKTRDGFVMEAFLLKPPDFDATRRYPVWVWAYAGPQAPQVRDRWGGVSYLWHQVLAERGIIVWMCDNRTASGKGAESAWPLHRRFGKTELEDIEDCLAWLKGQPYVDGDRIGIGGWSYGGFMTSYALTHSKSFALGIAGGSVTDWRDYDTIYTERYLGTPQNNPDGYRESSPVFFAKELQAELLLLHGTMDDNVHMQNTLQFAYELQKAGKPFRMMLYPKSRHAVTDPQLLRHMRGLMLDFIVEHLSKKGARATNP